MHWREHPSCPPDGAELCRLADVPDEGGYEIAFGGQVWAYENCCPHFSLPLNFDPQTFVTLDGLVMCAHHTAFFRFDDGKCVDGPCTGAGLPPIPVHCDDGTVRLSLAPADAAGATPERSGAAAD
jgi:nitrite reductase/ring-hydroxylating ferredoxin subunit